MLTGLPQMQPGLERQLTGRLRLDFTGPGGGDWDLVRIDEQIVVERGRPAILMQQSRQLLTISCSGAPSAFRGENFAR